MVSFVRSRLKAIIKFHPVILSLIDYFTLHKMVFQKIKNLSVLVADDSLTKKASLSAFALALDYGTRIMVALLITPWMVSGLGDYFFGTWQVLNRFVGYMTPASGKPTEVLKSTIANQQNSVDFQLKKSYIGATILLWFIFLPILSVVGGILTWFIPYWINTPENYVSIVRATTGLLVVNLAAISISNIPQSVLEGENLGYKRIGLSVLLILLGGGLTWGCLFLGFGIIGIAAVAVVGTLCSGAVYLFVARRFIPWFGVVYPSLKKLKHFASLSWWFLSWNMFMNLMITMDVVLLGTLESVEMVTSYTLMKYIPETIVGLVAILVFGTMPGLGGIIGFGDFEKAARIRGELMTISWLVVTVIGASILIWNRSFIELWVGGNYYIGTLLNLLIVLLVIQFVFLRIDSYVIDVTLQLKGKIILGIFSITISMLLGIIFLKYLNLGVIGLCVGILAGRSIMSVGFPVLVCRLLKTSPMSQLSGVVRPGLITLLCFLIACWFETKIPYGAFSGLRGWILFISLASLTACLFLFIVSLFGLSEYQRKKIELRFRSLLLK